VARTWGRKGRPWRRLQRRVYAEETHCSLCGKYVDQTLPNPRDRMARSVHHAIPPDVAPSLAHARENASLAHIGCNASYGRGAYKGQGDKGRRLTRAVSHGWTRRAFTPARVRVSVASAAADRDW
jgi:5-methylcytosine-specific restriction endonuclease McrA